MTFGLIPGLRGVLFNKNYARQEKASESVCNANACKRICSMVGPCNFSTLRRFKLLFGMPYFLPEQSCLNIFPLLMNSGPFQYHAALH